ncbi:MAG: hypothetical protein LH618_15275, partial [Saprospiraceae bacterium]|nr:hypothetical protein [Saprospiraceae bacterium]
ALYGAKELPGVVYPAPQRTTDPSAVVALSADIDRVQADIDRVQSGLKSGKNWVAENRTLPKLQQQRAAFVERRDAANGAAEWRAEAQHNDAMIDREEKVEKMQAYSVGAAIVAELVFLLCTAFCLYYLFRHYAEQQGTPEPITAATTNQATTFSQNGAANKVTDSSGLPRNEGRRMIGFGYDHRNAGANDDRTTMIVHDKRTCGHCGEPYTYMAAKQKYCSEPCRVAAWETRTGRTLKRQGDLSK